MEVINIEEHRFSKAVKALRAQGFSVKSEDLTHHNEWCVVAKGFGFYDPVSDGHYCPGYSQREGFFYAIL